MRYRPIGGNCASPCVTAQLAGMVLPCATTIKCQLAQLHRDSRSSGASQADLQEALNESLVVQLAQNAGVLGVPKLDEVLADRRGWFQDPFPHELLVVNDDMVRLHALRPPLTHDADRSLALQWAELQQSEAVTWCN